MRGNSGSHTLIYDEFYWRWGGPGETNFLSRFSPLLSARRADRPSSFKFAGPGRPQGHDCPRGTRGDGQACNLSWKMVRFPQDKSGLFLSMSAHTLFFFFFATFQPSSQACGWSEHGDLGDILPIKWWVVSPAAVSCKLPVAAEAPPCRTI